MTDVKIPRRDRFLWHDVLSEALSGVGSRPGRLVLTMLGTVLGTASVVVTMGLAATAAGQIDRQFDAVAATQVVITPKSTASGDASDSELPWDAESRVSGLAGVIAAGSDAQVTLGDVQVRAVSVTDPSAAPPASIPVVATSPGFLEAVDGAIVKGRYFDSGHDSRADRVVVLGAGAAQALNIDSVEVQPSIFIGDQPYTVIGIADNLLKRADLRNSVLIPLGTARSFLALDSLDELQIRIIVGAGPLVGRQAPIALNPANPQSYTAEIPPGPAKVQNGVKGEVRAIFLALGGVGLIVGGLGIAKVTLLSVMERIEEIGLRRALGARRRDIGSHFLTESFIVGLLGGLLGVAAGIAAVVATCGLRDWTPILDSRLVIAAALAGAVTGLVSGIYPAFKAASIEPVAALRGGL